MNAGEIVRKYLEIRDYMKREESAFEDRMKPYSEALGTLEDAAALLARQTGQKSLVTVFGTAFPVRQTRVKCTDKDSMIAWVFANNALQFLTAHVSKDAVVEYVEEHKVPPPGVGIEVFVQWQFRKT